MSEREELAELLEEEQESGRWASSPNADLYGFMADAILAAGYRKPRTITTAEELDALPDGSLVEATGSYSYADGTFTQCWIRPVPGYITGTERRVWETLIYGGDSGVHNMTTTDRITLPATILYAPEPQP